MSYDAPMFEDYRWVAMLDPVELADGIDRDTELTVAPLVVEAVTEVEHGGRPAWEAVVATTPAYEPRCGCCPLLRTRYIDLLEYRDYPEYVLPVYPEAYRVRLDVETGVCVFTDEIGVLHAGRVARPPDRGGRRADGRRTVRRTAARVVPAPVAGLPWGRPPAPRLSVAGSTAAPADVRGAGTLGSATGTASAAGGVGASSRPSGVAVPAVAAASSQ